jgi:hypothetical protein
MSEQSKPHEVAQAPRIRWVPPTRPAPVRLADVATSARLALGRWASLA